MGAFQVVVRYHHIVPVLLLCWKKLVLKLSITHDTVGDYSKLPWIQPLLSCKTVGNRSSIAFACQLSMSYREFTRGELDTA